MYKKYIKNQKGIGIAITLLAIMIISILGMALLIRSTSLAGVISQKNYSITATEAAKAGISHAIHQVETDLYYTTPISYTPLSTYTVTPPGERGYYKVDITNNLAGTTVLTSPYSGYAIPAGVIEVVSTGYAGNPAINDQKKSVKIIAMGNRLDVIFDPWSNAITLSGKITPGGGAGGNALLTDSYNSSVDPDVYSGGSDGDIAANGVKTDPNDPNSNPALDLGNRNIKGEVKVPPGTTVSGSGTYLDPNGVQRTLPGTNYTVMPEPILMPPVPEKVAGNIDVNPGQTLTEGGEYRDLLISGNSTTTLNEGIYIFRNLTLSGGGNADISLKINGNVTIYVTGNISLSGNANINTIREGQGNGKNATVHPDNPASQLKILGTSTCTSVEMGGAGSFCGAIYAPNADFRFHGMGNTNSDLWGSFAGKNAEFNGAKVSVHYDKALDSEGESYYAGIAKDSMRWVFGY